MSNFIKVHSAVLTNGDTCENFKPLNATEKVQIFFYPMLPDFQKSIAFRNVSRLRPLVILVRITCSTGEMTLTWEDRVEGKN
jgi:hypothetical protein